MGSLMESSLAYLPVGFEQVAIVDADLLPVLAEWKWSLGGNGYCYRIDTANGQRSVTYLHREVVRLTDGKCDAVCVDHANENPLDNRRSNLRLASKSENMSNRGKTRANTSGFKGVTLHKPTGKWKAYIKKDYKQHYLGLYDSREAAAAAYNAAAKRLHGEFANLNVI